MLSNFITETVCNEIVKIANKISPNTINEAKIKSKFSGEKFIFFTMRTSNHQINDVENQYPDYSGIFINKDGTIEPANTVFASGYRLFLKPKEGSFYAYDSIKIGFRKSSKNDSLKKILKKVENFAKKYINIIIENKDRMGHTEYVDYGNIIKGVKH